MLCEFPNLLPRHRGSPDRKRRTGNVHERKEHHERTGNPHTIPFRDTAAACRPGERRPGQRRPCSADLPDRPAMYSTTSTTPRPDSVWPTRATSTADLTNTTQGVFEDRIAALEGGTAGLAVASGAAAVEYAVRNITQAGDHIVAAKNIYGGTFNLLRHTLPRDGITTTFVDAGTVPDALRGRHRRTTRSSSTSRPSAIRTPTCADFDAITADRPPAPSCR